MRRAAPVRVVHHPRRGRPRARPRRVCARWRRRRCRLTRVLRRGGPLGARLGQPRHHLQRRRGRGLVRVRRVRLRRPRGLRHAARRCLRARVRPLPRLSPERRIARGPRALRLLGRGRRRRRAPQRRRPRSRDRRRRHDGARRARRDHRRGATGRRDRPPGRGLDRGVVPPRLGHPHAPSQRHDRDRGLGHRGDGARGRLDRAALRVWPERDQRRRGAPRARQRRRARGPLSRGPRRVHGPARSRAPMRSALPAPHRRNGRAHARGHGSHRAPRRRHAARRSARRRAGGSGRRARSDRGGRARGGRRGRARRRAAPRSRAPLRRVGADHPLARDVRGPVFAPGSRLDAASGLEVHGTLVVSQLESAGPLLVHHDITPQRSTDACAPP
jgi:hypothetical protein